MRARVEQKYVREVTIVVEAPREKYDVVIYGTNNWVHPRFERTIRANQLPMILLLTDAVRVELEEFDGIHEIMSAIVTAEYVDVRLKRTWGVAFSCHDQVGKLIPLAIIDTVGITGIAGVVCLASATTQNNYYHALGKINFCKAEELQGRL